MSVTLWITQFYGKRLRRNYPVRPIARDLQKRDICRPMRIPLLTLFLGAFLLAQAQLPCNVALNITPPTCPDSFDGVLTVVTNTPGQYTYFWSQDGTLQGPTATGLPVGGYTVIVTDTTGCVSVIDTVILPSIVPPLGTLTATDITCAGLDDGIVTLNLDAGPYNFQWADDPNLTDFTRTGLGPGIYSVLITGGLCPSVLSVELGDPGINITGETVYCPSFPPLLTAENVFGFQPDVYLWSTGDTTASFTVVVGTEGNVDVTAVDTTSGCAVNASIFLTLLPPPTASFAAPDSICLRSPGTGILLATNADSLVWRWGANGFSNDNFPTIVFDEPLWQPISLQAFDALGCGNEPVMDSVYVRPRFPADFTVEQVPCTPGIEVKFASSSDSCAFFVGDRLVLGQCRGTYQVDLERYNEYDVTFYSTRPDHCDDTSTVHIDVRTVPTAFLPNAFTPDGDNINDTWPGHLDIPDLDYEVNIFDRWGKLLWNAIDPEQKWDGSNLPVGVYVYVMRMRDPCNPTAEMTRKGFVTLVR